MREKAWVREHLICGVNNLHDDITEGNCTTEELWSEYWKVHKYMEDNDYRICLSALSYVERRLRTAKRKIEKLEGLNK